MNAERDQLRRDVAIYFFRRWIKQRQLGRSGQTASAYGAFLTADRLNRYLGRDLEPDQKMPVYAGTLGIERWYSDTVANAFVWWPKHKQEYES